VLYRICDSADPSAGITPVAPYLRTRSIVNTGQRRWTIGYLQLRCTYRLNRVPGPRPLTHDQSAPSLFSKSLGPANCCDRLHSLGEPLSVCAADAAGQGISDLILLPFAPSPIRTCRGVSRTSHNTTSPGFAVRQCMENTAHTRQRVRLTWHNECLSRPHFLLMPLGATLSVAALQRNNITCSLCLRTENCSVVSAAETWRYRRKYLRGRVICSRDSTAFCFSSCFLSHDHRSQLCSSAYVTSYHRYVDRKRKRGN